MNPRTLITLGLSISAGFHQDSSQVLTRGRELLTNYIQLDKELLETSMMLKSEDKLSKLP